LLQRSQRQQRETAGDEFQPAQHNHHETDRKYQRADQRLPRAGRRAECEAGGSAEQRSGQRAADEEVSWSKRQLLHTGIDHRGDDIGGFCVIHSKAPVATRGMAITRKNGCVIARKFDSKGYAASEFLEPPASFIAARTFVLNDTSTPSRPLAGFIHSICVPVQQFLK
jgi:hypothetical protein